MISLYWFALIPVLAGILLYLIPLRMGRWVAVSVQTVLLVLATMLFLSVRAFGTATQSPGRWPLPAGINLVADRVSTLFVLLTMFLFWLLLIYNLFQSYASPLFLALFLILQGLIAGIFLSSDLFNLYVLIEVATITVTVLIQFKREKRSVYDGLIYLMINMTAMTFFLLGTAMMYRLTGTLDLSLIRQRIDGVPLRTLILPCSLMMTAAGLKAAVFPLFSWLPKAHGTTGAPSVVSAVLSGLYVNVGLYLVLRLRDLFAPAVSLDPLLMVLGFMTAGSGIVLALSQYDIKRLLAYSTISQMGLILIGIAHQDAVAGYGALYHVISHALFKSVLFLIAGLIAEHYGTRDLRQISGVFKRLPVPSIAAVIAVLGITGAPFFNGSISKHLISSGHSYVLIDIGLILINLGTMIYCLRLVSVFTAPSANNQRAALPWNRQVVLMILAFLCLAGGLFGGQAVSWLFPVQLSLTPGAYLEKSIIYIASLAAGWLIHRFSAERLSRLVRRLRYEPGFNHMVLAVILFFIGHVIWLATRMG